MTFILSFCYAALSSAFGFCFPFYFYGFFFFFHLPLPLPLPLAIRHQPLSAFSTVSKLSFLQLSRDSCSSFRECKPLPQISSPSQLIDFDFLFFFLKFNHFINHLCLGLHFFKEKLCCFFFCIHF